MKFAICSFYGDWLYNVEAESKDEALAKAKETDPKANSAQLVAEDKDSEGHGHN